MYTIWTFILFAVAVILLCTVPKSVLAAASIAAFIGGITGQSIGIATGGSATAGGFLLALVSFVVVAFMGLVAKFVDRYGQLPDESAFSSFLHAIHTSPNISESDSDSYSKSESNREQVVDDRLYVVDEQFDDDARTATEADKPDSQSTVGNGGSAQRVGVTPAVAKEFNLGRRKRRLLSQARIETVAGASDRAILGNRRKNTNLLRKIETDEVPSVATCIRLVMLANAELYVDRGNESGVRFLVVLDGVERQFRNASDLQLWTKDVFVPRLRDIVR